MKAVKQGRVEYTISVVVPDDKPANKPLLTGYQLEVIRNNIPPSREVLFNGKSSRTNSADNDYGPMGNNIILKRAGSKKYYYCRELQCFQFYMELKSATPVSEELFNPVVELLDEYETINGYKCRRAKIETAGMLFNVYYTDELEVIDPTGAVLQHKGINGFILQQDEIPAGPGTGYFLRYTVKNSDFESKVQTAVFEIPAGYELIKDTGEAVKKNRQIMEQEDIEFREKNPLTDSEKQNFTGRWQLDGVKDKISVEIRYTGAAKKWENKFSFAEVNRTVLSGENKQGKTEDAFLWKDLLLVEDPPGYRLYRFDSGKKQIALLGNKFFTYKLTGKNTGSD